MMYRVLSARPVSTSMARNNRLISVLTHSNSSSNSSSNSNSNSNRNSNSINSNSNSSSSNYGSDGRYRKNTLSPIIIS